MPEYTFLDLFAGAGGFTEGLLLASYGTSQFRLIAASDVHPNARLTHEQRFRNQLGINYSFLLEDISSVSFIENIINIVKKDTGKTTVDVIVGGPPCQGFSVFGKRNEEDPRNNLFLSYLRAIQILNPKYFVMENVPGLATMYGGKTVQRIHEELYNLKPVKYGIHSHDDQLYLVPSNVVKEGAKVLREIDPISLFGGEGERERYDRKDFEQWKAFLLRSG